MYKLIKEAGNNANVSIKNTETNSTVVIGKMTMVLLSSLEAEGYKFDLSDPEAIDLKSKWLLDISDDLATKLLRSVMDIHPPKRAPKEKPEQPAKEPKPQVDAMDVLLGLATYK